jgi:signal peptidase I
MVFRFPNNPSVDFIKRVVGVPGDRIRYENKILYVNDVPMEQSFLENTSDVDLMSGQIHDVKELTENLNNTPHKIWLNFEQGTDKKEVVVPEGHYFTMGDNRDYSDDSRYWGFVPQELILGKADYIWMSWDFLNKDVRWKRIGTNL